MVFNSPEAAKLFQFHYCEKGELVSPYFFDFDNKTAVQLNEKKQIDDFF